jgi:hypothetical protein
MTTVICLCDKCHLSKRLLHSSIALMHIIGKNDYCQLV